MPKVVQAELLRQSGTEHGRLEWPDVVGPSIQSWRLGDGPLWSDGSMGSVYSTLAATVDPSLGMLSVTARTCSEESVEGVAFDITPAPTTWAYLGANGLPATGATGTLVPYTQAVAFNVAPGPTRIRASKAGMQFYDLDVVVQAGQHVTYAVVHPIE